MSSKTFSFNTNPSLSVSKQTQIATNQDTQAEQRFGQKEVKFGAHCGALSNVSEVILILG